MKNEDLVAITAAGTTLAAPVWILPGQPDDVVTLHFGHGRTRAGRVGNGTGVNAYRIRAAAGLWLATGLGAEGRRDLRARHDAAPLQHGRAPPRPHGHVRGVPQGPRVRPQARGGSEDQPVSRVQVRRARVGPRGEPVVLHRLQRLRRRLPVREQHPDDRQGPGAARPRDALDPDRPLLRGLPREPGSCTTSPSCACTASRRPARSSARSPPRRTARKASTR